VQESSSNLLRPTVRAVYDSMHDHPIAPRDIDLLSPTATDRIVGHESAARWKINTSQYL